LGVCFGGGGGEDRGDSWNGGELEERELLGAITDYLVFYFSECLELGIRVG
jgi:hypothetical protein